MILGIQVRGTYRELLSVSDFESLNLPANGPGLVCTLLPYREPTALSPSLSAVFEVLIRLKLTFALGFGL